jgi:hypothetical protein
MENEPEFVKDILKYYKLIQQEQESYERYRIRSISWLKEKGLIIEAYEVELRQRYENSEDVNTAIIGHVWSLLNNKHTKDAHAVGKILANPEKEKPSLEHLLLSVMLRS